MTEWEEYIHKDSILNANQRKHWAPAAEIKRVLRTRGMIRSRTLGRHQRVRITVTASYPTARKSDVYNLYPTMKAYVDGMVDGGRGLLPDDNDRHLSGPHMEWSGATCSRKDHFHFRFRLEDLGEALK